MGACCVVREGDREIDLPPPEIKGNAFQKFELSLPFARTYAETFAKRVRGAAFKHKTEGGGDGSTVTLEALRDTFRTSAWSDIHADDSRITKLISSNVFKNRKGQILADSLILFGVLNCGGDAKCKGEALYGVLQEGGVAK